MLRSLLSFASLWETTIASMFCKPSLGFASLDSL